MSWRNGYNYCLLQRGNGYYEDSEDSQCSKETAMKKDYTFQKVMETQKDLKNTDGFDWLESTELAIDKRKFLLNRLFVKQPIPQDED